MWSPDRRVLRALPESPEVRDKLDSQVFKGRAEAPWQDSRGQPVRPVLRGRLVLAVRLVNRDRGARRSSAHLVPPDARGQQVLVVQPEIPAPRAPRLQVLQDRRAHRVLPGRQVLKALRA